MFKHISLALDVFRKGASVIDQAKAKNRAGLGIAVGALIALAPPVLRLANIHVDISPEDAAQLGVAVATIAGLFSTFGTSDKVGILPAKPEATDTYTEKLIAKEIQQEQDLRGGP